MMYRESCPWNLGVHFLDCALSTPLNTLTTLLLGVLLPRSLKTFESHSAQDGCDCSRSEASASNQISARVQSKSGHAEGECRGDEEVSSCRNPCPGSCSHKYRWIAGKISEILGSEDDVVIELCFNLIEGSRFVRVHVMFAIPGS